MGDGLKSIGMHIARYGLAIVLLWIGGMMFTAYQAEGIRPLVANSPLMSWVYRVMSVGGFSSLLGVVEIAIGVLIALRPVWPMGSAVGSGLAAGMFLTTLSFLLTTPGWEPSLGGFPALSAMPGQFLLKDVVLLGASLFTAGESLEAAGSRRGILPNDGAHEASNPSAENDDDALVQSPNALDAGRGHGADARSGRPCHRPTAGHTSQNREGRRTRHRLPGGRRHVGVETAFVRRASEVRPGDQVARRRPRGPAS